MVVTVTQTVTGMVEPMVRMHLTDTQVDQMVMVDKVLVVMVLLVVGIELTLMIPEDTIAVSYTHLTLPTIYSV